MGGRLGVLIFSNSGNMWKWMISMPAGKFSIRVVWRHTQRETIGLHSDVGTKKLEGRASLFYAHADVVGKDNQNTFHHAVHAQ